VIATDPAPAGDSPVPADATPAVDVAATDPAPAGDSSVPADATPAVDVAATDPAASVPAVDVSAPADAAPVVVPPMQADSALGLDSSAPAAGQTAADILSQVPDGTQVVVTDANGNTLPLASNEAAQVIVNGDPMWCPAGVAPIANTGGCSGSYNFIGNQFDLGLWDYMRVNSPTHPGVIWIAWNYDGTLEPSNTVNLDAFYLGPMWGSSALTIQGGWNGTPGSTALNAAQPYSTFTVPLWIQNWTAAVTLKNIVVDDSSAPVTLGSSDNALKVTTTGNITLDTVKVQNNSDTYYTLGGAYLDNTTSSTGATVTIKNSSFDQNAGSGLQVLSKGIVTTTNLSVNGNGSPYGAWIDNHNATSDKPVTMTGFSQFNNNGGWGLRIDARGLITLANVAASNNTGWDGVTLSSNLGVTIQGVNQFNNNGSSGLEISTNGAITLNSITANNNGASGANLVDNTKAVTLTGTNFFNGNGLAAAGFGLKVKSKGVITLNNVTASGNNTGGDDGGVFLDTPGAVTINGYGTFEHNANYGLEIFRTFGSGAILLNNINSNRNGFGAFIDNCDGTFEFGGGGYEVVCFPGAKPITLKGTNNFNGNTGYGLEAVSNGAIVAANLTANGNGSAPSWYQTFNSDLNATSVGNAFLDAELGITLTGVNTFNNNKAYEGVTIYSDGKVSVSNLNANGNSGRGAYVSGTGTTTLTVVNTFNDNGGAGLTMDNNYGTINVSNVTANGNTGYGMYLKNDYVTATPWNVTLLGVNQFNENGNTGLSIYTYGAVLTNNISANYNTGGTSEGLYVDNHNGLATLPKPVTLNGFNNFNGNWSSGINIKSIGLVTLNNIAANMNLAVGVSVKNDYLAASAASPGVTILGSSNSFSNNTYTGLGISSNGAISLSNINAGGNGSYGANLNNSTGLLKTVSLLGVNNFNGNASTGLMINSSGIVTLSRITANNNDPTNSASGSGIYVTTSKAITLTCGYAYNNGDRGLYLHSSGGSVTVKGAYSFSNGTNYDLSIPNTITYPCLLP
jgi:hypothetical protein